MPGTRLPALSLLVTGFAPNLLLSLLQQLPRIFVCARLDCLGLAHPGTEPQALHSAWALGQLASLSGNYCGCGRFVGRRSCHS